VQLALLNSIFIIFEFDLAQFMRLITCRHDVTI
jgi:hypothetical protein